jgi:hypothetical protein
MKRIVVTEEQTKLIIGHIINEQNEIRKEGITVDFGAVWPMGKWKLTGEQMAQITQKAIQITDFITKNKGSKITIQIEAGESQVTNKDNEVSPPVELAQGVLSQKRGESMVNFLKSYFQSLVGKAITQNELPNIPEPKTIIGTTPYKKGDITDPKTGKVDPQKAAVYQNEQFVRAIVTASKDYECLVGMEITIGYYPGKNRSDHTCDEAIFELRMNGIPLGEVNLNNSLLDVSLGYAEKTNQQKTRTYQNLIKKAELSWDRDVKGGTVRIKNDPQKAEEQKAAYIKDFAGEPPAIVLPPSWLEPLAAKNGFKTTNEYEAAVIKINQSFTQYGRKSDGAQGGQRSQTFILDGTKAKSIIDSSPSDKIVLSIIPLVSQNGKYKLYHKSGSHADTPWVTIKSKKSVEPLYDGEPNMGMKRGSTAETVLLQTDLCGNPITRK